jgi:hypothetical protein
MAAGTASGTERQELQQVERQADRDPPELTGPAAHLAAVDPL